VNYNGPKVFPQTCLVELPLSEVILNSAVGHMLENPSIRSVLVHVTHLFYPGVMGSENLIGADNQQERPGDTAWWIVGFVDGEGCFGASIVRNRTCRLGWQVQPEFSVTQGERSLESLELLQQFFTSGTVIRNRRYDNHRETMYRFSVRRTADLRSVIVPFFELYPLRTAKRDEFQRFVRILELMKMGEHLHVEGLERIAHIVETMNHRKPARCLESSEAIRQPPISTNGMKIWS
jgi:hypothetical protein